MPCRIEVVYALPDEQFVLRLDLPDGATVGDALALAAEDIVFTRLPLAELTVGIWGEVVPRDRVLQDGDRVELYRPLLVDPREARRRRATRS